MTKNKLKQMVRKVLLEKLVKQPEIHGKLIKKKLDFRGVQRECVVTGTISDINEYATKNNLKFIKSSDSFFGGYFLDEMTSYEFEPNPEFYGEMMETNMSAREQLSRICGTNDKVLTELNKSQIERLVSYIFKNESFYSEKTNLVFESITNCIENKLHDKTQFTSLFEYLVKQAILNETTESFNKLTDADLNYATNLLSTKFFNELLSTESIHLDAVFDNTKETLFKSKNKIKI
tara:strand:+ start:1127 stop:1828 length:702 start_codon:yes stop_codon:yes gene_type:complete